MQDTPQPKKKRVASFGNVALLLIVTTLIGQGLGFLRTKIVNANFPAIGPHSTDSYFAAFNIPDFFFYTLAAGALGVAFMPVLAERLHKGDKKGIWELASSLLNLLGLVMFGAGLVIFIFAKPLIHHIVAPNLTPEQLNVAATIMRFLALNPLIFTISGVLNAVQQTLGRFFFYAIAPLFYNSAIIASVYIFRDTSIGIEGLGIGALVGALVQLGVVCLGLRGMKFRWHPKIMWRSKDFKMILKQLPPRSVDQGIDQIESIIETNFARRLGEGNISYYNNANTLQTAPTLLIGTTISTAVFPLLNNRLAHGRPDLFRKDFLRILRLMIWVSTPATIVCYFCRGYLARLIFSRNAPEIALIFGYLTLAIFFGTLYTIMSRWFYAQKDTRTPLFVSVFTIALNILLVSMWARNSTYGVAGLGMAQSVVSMVEVFILGTIMVIRDHKLIDRAFWGGVMRILSVAGFTLVVGMTMVSLLPLGLKDVGASLGLKLSIIVGATFLTHILVSGLFGLEEAQPIFRWVKRVLLKPIHIQY